MNRGKILEDFVSTYVAKNKKERTLHELSKKRGRFVDRLNHNIEDTFNNTKLVELQNVHESSLAKKLNVKAGTQCYIISHDDLDDQIVDFETALSSLYGNGLGFCIIPLNSKSIYIESEQVNGAPKRYLCC